ncbi:DHA2 family efflux MFS transporter permease subunit [Streptacidiphilus neutrinimicus]|uniref:DHA2 family efflux MFS transporter permease subunit n=1 Tax=Streptacidiphilus neutrinimicus TaxID=105420 RepID=UPI0006934E17|nr:DHA2 family efflux MFS transporter permease subunit [Streptacidiphilus neutrinimicus]
MSRLRDNPWATLVVLSLGYFMTLLDSTMVTIAIPGIIGSLHTTLPVALWALNGYIITVTVLLITAGRLGDRYGPRQLFVVGIAFFTVASLLCGLATAPGVLVGARVLQGVGAALLMPQSLTLIVATFPRERRGTALGVWGAIGGVASVLGPSLGGLLIDAVGWRWIFLINLPIGMLVVAAGLTVVPDLRTGRQHRLDVLGVVLASTALGCFAYAVTNGADQHWGPVVWALLVAAALLGVGFAVRQRQRQDRDPLVPFALLRIRSFTVMLGVAAAITGATFGITVLAVLYSQSVLGLSPFRAGLILAPASATSMLVAFYAGRLADRMEGRHILLTGMLVQAAGILWTALLMTGSASWTAFLAPMAVIGVGNGCSIAPRTTVAMREVPQELTGAASGVLETVRQAGALVFTAGVVALAQGLRSVTGGVGPAMRAATLLPIAALVLGAVACLALAREAAEPTDAAQKAQKAQEAQEAEAGAPAQPLASD